MKIVKNISMQGLNIPFDTRGSVKSFFLAPKDQVEIPDSWNSKVVESLVHRRLVKMTQKAEAAPAVNPRPAPKRYTKSN